MRPVPHIALLRAGLMVLLGLGTVASTALHAQAGAEKHIEITGNQRLRIVYESAFTWPGGGGYSAVFRLPIPPDTGGQQIEHFDTTLKGGVVTDGDDPPHRLLAGTLRPGDGNGRRVQWRVVVTGTFQTRQLVDGPPSASARAIVPPGSGEFLGSTESINWRDASFQDWLDSSRLRRAGGESPVAYGQRVYNFFRANGRYEYPPVSAWNAAAVCQRLRTDCGGFSLVFAAACRANHIPARLLVGQCFKARQSGGTVELTGDRQAHVIAEFFDPEIGWVPEDISSTFLRVPGYGDLNFFGRDPGYFFAWHFDSDYHFDLPRKSDAHVQWIQNPNLWFSENADEANDTVSHHWDVETLR